MKTLKKILLGILMILVTCVILVFALFFRTDLTRDQLSEYINSESEFIELPSGAVAHYRDEGNPNGPVIYLAHGGLGSLHNWEPWIDSLAPHYRLISADFPAHGLTGPVPGDVYTRGAMVKFLDELMVALDIERFSIAGHSMGGGIVITYALEHPEKIETMLLIGSEGVPGGNGYDDGGIFISEDVLQPGSSDTIENITLPLTESYMLNFVSPWVAGQTLKLIVGDESVVTSENAEYFARILRHLGNRYAIALMFRQFLVDITDPRDLEPRLGEITVPTLFLAGQVDPLVTPDIAERFHELLPNSELKIYGGVGHMIMMEIPEESVQDYLAFLRASGI